MAERVTRRHRDGERRSSAVFSRCGLYRYALTREWGQGGRVSFIMLNPSTADHLRNDPTIARCESRARDMGATGFRIVNLFAFRATDPRELRATPEPVGPGNDADIRRAARWADQVICAWGMHGGLHDRGREVRDLLRRQGIALLHLGLTRDGAPRHPLYLPRHRQAIPWD
ncbi:MAG TPA: DUF1643 domain-containing protein [Paracoccus sp. (in: a-proteobacteria)]|nr:DUF1643 domain-containing protein [Paracoccus sp. (in: a-proteobacteria)]HRM73104.1 DUF1643 domain-containing protein [Paracoccus sp. (in: a-proteobacteria)]